jgi:hypothetical protein
MGGNWYCRAHGDALFEIEKPITTIGIGFDNIPASIKSSAVLTGNNLGQLGNIEVLPSRDEVENFKNTMTISFSNEAEKHQYAKALLELNKVHEAWCILLS